MHLSITKKFILTLTLLLLICASTIYFVAVYNYSTTLTTALSDNIREAQSNFESIIKASQNEFLHMSRISAKYAGLSEAISSGDQATVSSIASNIMKQAEVNIVTITDAKGDVVVRAHSERLGDSIINQESITQALRGHDYVNLVIGVEAPSFRASSPIMLHDEIVGTISVGSSLSSPLFLDWLGKFLGVQVTFFMDDTRVMSTIQNEKGERISGTRLGNPVIEKHVLKDEKLYFGESTIIGTKYLSAYWPAYTDNKKVVGMWFIGLPISAVLKSEKDAFLNTLLASIVVLSLMIIIAAITAYKLAKPIKCISRYAANIASGNEKEAALNVNSNDEYGLLARSLQGMVAKLKEQSSWYEAILNCIPSPLAAMDVNKNFTFVNSGVCNMLNKKPEELIGLPCYNWGASICRTENCAIDSCERGIDSINFEQPGLGHFRAMAARLYDGEGKHIGYVDMVFDRNQEVELLNNAEKALSDGRHEAAYQLENIVNNITTASTLLSVQIDQSAKGADEASGRIAETAAAMDEMNGTVLEVAKNASNSADIAENTKQKATEGTTVIKDTESTMIRLREESVAIRTSMDQLSGHAQSINAVMSVISDIADQTNLLALNAAIEAARAGEAGRGFAVVADEVRKLAEKTMTSTSDVSSAIVAIQQSTEINVKQIDVTVKSIEKATELAITSGEALNGIMNMAEESADGIRAIATASEEQSSTSDEITQSILAVSNIVNDTSAAMHEAEQAVHSLSDQAQELSRLIEELKK